MSIIRKASRVIRQQLRASVAWLPLANTFELGDFGVFSGGVFTRMGNIRGLGVDFDSQRSDGPPFDFRSDGTTEVRVTAAAEGHLTSRVTGEAALKIGFAQADSIYLHAAEIEVSEIRELLPVAAALRKHPQWRMRYRVVHRVWRAIGGIFITSQQGDADIELSGSVEEVGALQNGRGSVGVQVHSKRNVGLDLIGHDGPIALGLFRVRVVNGTPDFVSFSASPADDGGVEFHEPDDDPPDDL
jgi:hypothetical protein